MMISELNPMINLLTGVVPGRGFYDQVSISECFKESGTVDRAIIDLSSKNILVGDAIFLLEEGREVLNGLTESRVNSISSNSANACNTVFTPTCC